jgi:hypothetical protein
VRGIVDGLIEDRVLAEVDRERAVDAIRRRLIPQTVTKVGSNSGAETGRQQQ